MGSSDLVTAREASSAKRLVPTLGHHMPGPRAARNAKTSSSLSTGRGLNSRHRGGRGFREKSPLEQGHAKAQPLKRGALKQNKRGPNISRFEHIPATLNNQRDERDLNTRPGLDRAKDKQGALSLLLSYHGSLLGDYLFYYFFFFFFLLSPSGFEQTRPAFVCFLCWQAELIIPAA